MTICCRTIVGRLRERRARSEKKRLGRKSVNKPFAKKRNDIAERS